MTSDLSVRVKDAVRSFWAARDRQAERQGRDTGVRDAGARAAVTGGAQMEGFVELVRGLLFETGLPAASVYTRRSVELPGWFRAEKSWDLIVVTSHRLVASIEFKSQIGPSFGNNFNNRTEEALGSATDLWAAYREGAFAPSARPWLGYLMLLEEAPSSVRPVKVVEPHFNVFPEFRGASYALRYELLLTKLLRDRLYDGTCLVMSNKETGPTGEYKEPNPELSFTRFTESLLARIVAALRTAD
jgi:hypothetical protein